MKTTKDMIQVMQASLEGKQIEQLDCNNSMSLWEPKNTDDTWWDWGDFDYRIKPEPKCVPLSPEDIKQGDAIKHKGGCNSTWGRIVSVGRSYVGHAFGGEIVETSYTDLMEDGYMIRSIGESEWRPCWKVEE